MEFVVSTAGGAGADFGAGGADAARARIADAFTAILPRLGPCVRAGSPAEGLREARRRRAVHLCFAYPHELPPDAGVETVPIFGIRSAECPNRPFAGDPATAWQVRLRKTGRAACFSAHAAAAVAQLTQGAARVAVLPLPVQTPPEVATPVPATMRLRGSLLDTSLWASTGLTAADAVPSQPAAPPAPTWRKTPRYRLGIIRLHLRAAYREALLDLLPPRVARLISLAARIATLASHRRLSRPPASPNPHPDWRTGASTVDLDGLVFAAALGPWDPGWGDLLTSFVTVCRRDPTAVLAVKTANLDDAAQDGFAGTLRRLGPFMCRVVILDGEIDGGLAPMIAASSWYVCACHGQGAPLPMMRFLAAGRPAISPNHSALADLVDPSCAFLVTAGPAADSHPGDPDARLDATLWRLNWESLCAGIAAARAAPPHTYRSMAQSATARMRAHCAPDAVLATLRALLAPA